MRRLVCAIALAVVALTLSACGSSDGGYPGLDALNATSAGSASTSDKERILKSVCETGAKEGEAGEFATAANRTFGTSLSADEARGIIKAKSPDC
jgi:hypothetical protein